MRLAYPRNFRPPLTVFQCAGHTLNGPLGGILMFKAVSLIIGLLALGGSLPAQVEPHAGQWKTWIIASGSALRLPAPPDAAATAAEIQWGKDCAAARNQTALAQIRFWDAAAPGY